MSHSRLSVTISLCVGVRSHQSVPWRCGRGLLLRSSLPVLVVSKAFLLCMDFFIGGYIFGWTAPVVAAHSEIVGPFSPRAEAVAFH